MKTPQYTPYADALVRAMDFLGGKEDTIFIGQQLIWPGNPMSTTVGTVPRNKKIELPVMEESQMGMSLGLAMMGKFVITFYPRWDFLICATNQLVNHVDKIREMSNKEWSPNMIIRVGKGSTTPLDPGYQHRGNYISEFNSMLEFVDIYNLTSPKDIEEIYQNCYRTGGINIIVEYPELYYLNPS